MSTKATVSIEDYDGEKTTTSFWVQDVSALNYDSVATDISEVRNAIAGVTLGEIRNDGFRKEYPQSSAVVSNQSAQRELKWLAHMQDTTQFLDAANTIANPRYLSRYTFEIGTADPSLLSAQGKNLMDITAGAGLTLKNALETNSRSPWNNKAASTPTQIVEYVELVGRAT